MGSPTLTIDTESDPGAWATAIAHTPHLARQISETERPGLPLSAGSLGGEAAASVTREPVPVASPIRRLV